MKVADTSLLFAVFQNDDVRHEQARKALAGQRVVIPTEVLAELIGVLGSKVNRAVAKRAFSALVAQDNVLIDGHLDAKRAIALCSRHRKLSFVDACVVACCEARGCGVLAYDSRIEGLVVG